MRRLFIFGNRPMHEFQVLATFLVICAIYLGLFYASEKFFMKDKE